MEHIGPYRIIRTIGVGGMGEVFLAGLEREGGFYKQVALKRALPHLMADPALVASFEREARLAAALSHRNIVQIFDFGRDADTIWLAMEYVHGVDLKAVLDAGPIPLGLALEIGVASARALAYAHRATDPRGRPLNLVHRDVSPHNLLLSFEGDVKLADFGLALPQARWASAAGHLQGKYAYMSPEQARGEAVDGRADLFSLGVVLYEMLSGARCFFADDGTEAILDRVRAARPLAPLREAAPALPAGLAAVIESILAADPADRPADGAALADALREAAVAADVAIGDPPLGTWLAAQFPHRAEAPTGPAAEGTRTAGSPLEATATAQAPIEATAAAQAPIASTPPATPPANAPPATATAAEVTPPPAPPAPGRGRVGLLAGGLALVLGAAWALWPAAPQPATPLADATPADATQADATPADATLIDATPVDAAPPARADAAPPADAAPAIRPRPARPRRPTTAAPATAAPATMAPATAPPSAPETRAAPPSAPPSAAAIVSAPASVAPAGPRLKARGAALTVSGGHAQAGGWRSVPGEGLLLRAADRGGPAVTVRVRPGAGGFVATVVSQPFGHVLVDGRDLGPTPAGAVPLRPGRRTLAVRTQGGDTTLTLEVAP